MSSSGRANSRLIASTDAARRADLLSLEELQRVESRGDVATIDLDELAVAVVERVGLRTLDIQRPDDTPWMIKRNRQRAP